MIDKNYAKFGSIASITAGALMLVATLNYLFWPSSLITGGYDFFRILLQHETLYRFTYITFLLYALVSIGVVMVISEYVQSVNPPLIRWISFLAIIGFSVTAINFLYQSSVMPNTARSFMNQQGTYEGVGLNFYSTPSGEILLFPFQNSPAAKAGIIAGDALVAVNEKPVAQGMPIEDIIVSLQNSPNGETALKIQTNDMEPKEVKVSRGKVVYWDISAQNAISALGAVSFDPNYIFGFGLVGLWFIAINFFALQKKIFPKRLMYIGIATGIAYLCFVLGFALDISFFHTLGKLSGLTLGPIWYIWTGIILKKENPHNANA